MISESLHIVNDLHASFLVPMDQRSKEEARMLGEKGGIASGVTRRRKRSLREAADLYLSLPPADKRRWNKLARKGLAPERRSAITYPRNQWREHCG